VDEDTMSKTIELFSKKYDKNFLNKTRPYAGIKQLLNELTNRGVLWGSRDYNELKKYGATYIIEKPEELLKFVQE